MPDIKPHRYIVTDPCYIMDKKQYQAICRRRAGEPDFEDQPFPLISVDCDTGHSIVFWAIVGTGGDGGLHRVVRSKDGTRRGEEVYVDSGMLCVAEDFKGWRKLLGYTYPTLKSALTALPKIAKKL